MAGSGAARASNGTPCPCFTAWIPWGLSELCLFDRQVPRVIAPSPPPELHSSGPQVLVHDRPKQREAPGAFAKAELPQDLRNLQDVP